VEFAGDAGTLAAALFLAKERLRGAIPAGGIE